MHKAATRFSCPPKDFRNVLSRLPLANRDRSSKRINEFSSIKLNQYVKNNYSESEFDSFNDLQTELPINLESLYNIFNSLIQFTASEITEKQLGLVFTRESLKFPMNPYIPLFQYHISKDINFLNQSFIILGNSGAFFKYEPLKRIETFGIFNNEKSTDKRVKDFRFTPNIFLLCSKGNLKSESVHQLEYHSRLITDHRLLYLKMQIEFQLGNYGKVLSIFQLTEAFESKMDMKQLYAIVSLGIESMTRVGYKQERIQVLEKLIEKHGNNCNELVTLLDNLCKE